MGKDFTTALRPAIVLTILFAILLGLVYPLAMTGIGQAIFPHQASGSLVRDASGRAIGSAIVGQAFTTDGYFQTRPSAAGDGYDGLASSGSNLGPASQVLANRVSADLVRQRAAGISGPVPADLVTASGSGLDPDISPAAARAQVARVARTRGLPAEQVRALVEHSIDQPLLGILGEPRVNVLALNMQLDRFGGPR
ncbi:ATPase [Croceibacterium mercuriale]|uniref:Potassium-transporting ATPase KdpC subunit n=1 Tax=Croceibacterium mercuriale TaxID=1572751 RepID=A0A0B2C3E3_9SPHN|nr:potassium-transporting ATPase subunit KdpC [Croceibacterium mercuriale]KHL26556.1 ATPase [Croceibacterium mercuriale]